MSQSTAFRTAPLFGAFADCPQAESILDPGSRLVELGDLERATAQFEALHRQIDRRQLSDHAQGWFDQTMQLMQKQ